MARTGAKIDGKGTSRRRKSGPTGNGHSDLIRQLWEAAVNLRGAIEPADYKRYVLPIIFLRFLSLRYERRRRELERMVKEPDSEYYTKNAKQAAAILEDPDEYRAVGAFILPKPARWDEIVRHAQADDIKVRLDTALEALEKAYPDKLRGLLPRTYAGSNLARENVTGLINLFSRDIFKEDGADLIGRVYEYFIGEFADSEGKRGGEYFTPVSIVRTLVAMLAPEQGVVFDPCTSTINGWARWSSYDRIAFGTTISTGCSTGESSMRNWSLPRAGPRFSIPRPAGSKPSASCCQVLRNRVPSRIS